MPKLPQITGKELVAALQRAGFEIARQRGSHVQLRKTLPDGKKATFPVPVHAGQTIKTGTLHGILRLARLTDDELIALL